MQVAKEIKEKMRAGDVLAYQTKGLIGKLIRVVSPTVNHIAILATNPISGKLSAFTADQTGAHYETLDTAINGYSGTVFWLIPSDEFAAKFDYQKFDEVIASLNGVPYDFLGFIGVGIDDAHIDFVAKIPFIGKYASGITGRFLKRIFTNKESMAQTVCSGTTAWTDKLCANVKGNPSEASPLDIVRRKKWRKQYSIVKFTKNKKFKYLKQYNTKELEYVN